MATDEATNALRRALKHLPEAYPDVLSTEDLNKIKDKVERSKNELMTTGRQNRRYWVVSNYEGESLSSAYRVLQNRISVLIDSSSFETVKSSRLTAVMEPFNRLRTLLPKPTKMAAQKLTDLSGLGAAFEESVVKPVSKFEKYSEFKSHIPAKVKDITAILMPIAVIFESYPKGINKVRSTVESLRNVLPSSKPELSPDLTGKMKPYVDLAPRLVDENPLAFVFEKQRVLVINKDAHNLTASSIQDLIEAYSARVGVSFVNASRPGAAHPGIMGKPYFAVPGRSGVVFVWMLARYDFLQIDGWLVRQIGFPFNMRRELDSIEKDLPAKEVIQKDREATRKYSAKLTEQRVLTDEYLRTVVDPQLFKRMDAAKIAIEKLEQDIQELRTIYTTTDKDEKIIPEEVKESISFKQKQRQQLKKNMEEYEERLHLLRQRHAVPMKNA